MKPVPHQLERFASGDGEPPGLSRRSSPKTAGASPAARSTRLQLAVTVAALLAVAPALTAGEMRAPLKIDWAHPRAVQALFGSYGYAGRPCVFVQPDGFRLTLPAAEGVPQSGVYSTFVLAGDCEVVVTYHLLAVPPPTKGYGAGLGLAFDAGDDVGRGSIQRLSRVQEGGAYVLQTSLPSGGQAQEEYQVVPTKARQGRIGLRREGKELVFLAADDPKAEPEEIGRLPFTERTIQAVRLFADAGGSPTAVDVRLHEVTVRAEETTGGVPKGEVRASHWWLLLFAVPPAVVVLGFWLWRRGRDRDGGEAEAVRPPAPAKKSTAIRPSR
ncbi:MAG TPA: hypothetical protein VJ739_12760 [Gemmataceae bacterium]|nr:hypothetical protein [Gemmataceae bacterium]